MGSGLCTQCGQAFKGNANQKRCNACRFQKCPRLTVDDVRYIRAHVRFVGDVSAMAERYNVSRQSISNIVHGRSWAWVS